MVEHPKWDDPNAVNEAIKNLKESDTINGLITSKPIDIITYEDIITFDRKFIECRECGKECGVVVWQSGTEVDFECMDCYANE